MLGELYRPKGDALETAKAVLEVDDVQGCNVGIGCPNGCEYCYGPLVARESRESWLALKLPKKPPRVLVQAQLAKAYEKSPLSMMGQKGFFLSFLTDPFLPANRQNTEDLIEFLQKAEYPSKIGTLSKLGISESKSGLVRHGVSIVSLDEDFRRKFEPNALPFKNRLRMLCLGKSRSYSWASVEPYPCSAIWRQKLEPLLEELRFWGTDLIVFGKWNYDARARTEEARQEYAADIEVLEDFCKGNGIRLHVKSKTRNFVEAGKT